MQVVLVVGGQYPCIIFVAGTGKALSFHDVTAVRVVSYCVHCCFHGKMYCVVVIMSFSLWSVMCVVVIMSLLLMLLSGRYVVVLMNMLVLLSGKVCGDDNECCYYRLEGMW